MILKLSLVALLAATVYANQFECSSDTILRFGVEKRVKELQKDCTVHAQPETELLCESTADLEKAWKEFVDTADEYSKAVTSCRETVARNKQRGGSPVRRRRAHKHDHDDGHDHHDKEEGHKHRRHVEHDPNDPNQDHSTHNHGRRSVDHDPNDPNIDHSTHNHGKRHADHDPNDPNIDHSTHNHRRRNVEHDPNDPNIDHSTHNHRARRAHRCPLQGYRDDGSNPCNPPPIHHVSQRTAEDDDRIIRERRSVDVQLSRVRRGDCSVAGNQELHKLQDKYVKHCERENICLPDEDLGPNAAEDFKKLHKKHAATYAAYVRELSACYGSLKN